MSLNMSKKKMIGREKLIMFSSFRNKSENSLSLNIVFINVFLFKREGGIINIYVNVVFKFR